ncbi:hypothetical protein GOM49_01950 [Clostridium bovifaecis]|uniref:CARD domain-containing protein n=1 Tax=Clostridium bovifaecis TaxID=2184719 RepID=A0A6I6EJR4_9CLOT|nr:hypothetical protein GOM49_01950 [Clostridium bovifaecis]
MKSNKLVMKLMTGVIIAGVTLSTSGTAFAGTKDKASSTTTKAWTQNGKEYKKGFSEESLKTQLDNLVKSGTITQAQEDKIVEFMNEKNEARKTEMKKVGNMTEEEKKAYFENQKAAEKVDAFKELVGAGIINQEQADKIKAVIPQGRENKKWMKGRIDFKTIFDTLVKSGKITQAQEDKIIEFMNKKEEARKTEMEKIKNMTEEERKAYFQESKSKEKTDLLSELVAAGIINQEEADIVKAALPQHKELRVKQQKSAVPSQK